MAITTFTELKAAVASWANRTDLTSQLDDFVTLAEARLNDMLLLKNMEADETLTLSIGVNFVALPTGFVSPIALWIIVDGVRVKLSPALPQELPYDTDSTQPKYWAIDGANIRFDCPAGAAYSARLRCIKQSNLGASVATNYLLTKRPDIYLAGCMVEVARFTNDAELFNSWEPKFLKACAELKASDNRNRAIVPLRTDIPITSHRANIIRGD
jgi:hypothetical protein